MAQSIIVREANEDDVSKIREIFYTVYQSHYPYPKFYDEQWLKRSVFSDDILMLVAEKQETGEIVGSASVVLDIGAHSDLVGEFGRLVVQPEPRHAGIGTALMAKRVELVQNRLHVGLVENRTSHCFSQKISSRNGFVPVGFLPLKLAFQGYRESMALFVRYFGNALALRNNHPRIIPEAHALAQYALKNCGLPCDAIVDEDTAAYPHNSAFELDELSAEEFPSLLQIERGRVRNRELFGPLRLHYGFFRLQVGHGQYLVAREIKSGNSQPPITGAVGFTRDEEEKILKIFELITVSDQAVRFLLEQLLTRARQWDVNYIEADISAHSPRMQRTFLELGFLPVAYVPAMVFCDVERFDVVRMARVEGTLDPEIIQVIPEMEPFAELVRKGLDRKSIVPAIAEAVHQLDLFKGMNQDQVETLAGVCTLSHFEQGRTLFSQGSEASEMHILIQGEVEIFLEASDQPVGHVKAGEPVGEISLLTQRAHTASAVAASPVSAATLTAENLTQLTRRRPDIGLLLYKNLAIGLGLKLKRMDATSSS